MKERKTVHLTQSHLDKYYIKKSDHKKELEASIAQAFLDGFIFSSQYHGFFLTDIRESDLTPTYLEDIHNKASAYASKMVSLM